MYYLVFTTVYTLAVCGVGFWLASRHWTPTLEVAKQSLPPFEVKVDQGHLTTTLPEPFVFSDADFTLIVDTSGKALDASGFESAILVSKTKGIFKKNRFETREYSWSEIPDFQITTEDLIDWLAAHKQEVLWTVFGTLALGIIPLAWMMLIPVVFFVGFLLLIPAKVLGSPLRFGQTLSIAFYAVTLPTLVQTFLLFGRGKTGGGLFWLIYLAWALVGVVVCRFGPPLETAIPPMTPPPPAVPPPPGFRSTSTS